MLGSNAPSIRVAAIFDLSEMATRGQILIGSWWSLRGPSRVLSIIGTNLVENLIIQYENYYNNWCVGTGLAYFVHFLIFDYKYSNLTLIFMPNDKNNLSSVFCIHENPEKVVLHKFL